MLQGTRPIFMYMGRVAVEKNIRAFLDLDLPGTKYVVGDGPDLALLRKRYRQMHFTGFKFGKEPAGDLADADVFVFPSRTDTFGLVMLKTLACGVPVAAYPVTGPVDILVQGETGIIDEDLGATALETLKLDRSACRRHALAHSWASASEIFAEHLVCNVAAATSSPGR
jgi:glycosyltransferase involved in cell wall biosynthesis